MDETIRRIAVLYADVSGSTRLYEQYGDAVARADVAACLEVLTQVVERLGGHVVKTIGDEVMCVFANPVKAAIAASEMQSALREASTQGRFRSGTLRIKVGWHYGEAVWKGDEVHGEAPVTAQQVIKMAKAEEVLASGEGLAALPAGLKRGARLVDRVEAEGWTGTLDVYELPWEETDELTQMATAPAPGTVIVHEALVLEHGDRTERMDAERTHFHLGRAEDLDMPVNGRFTSRHHAEIAYRHGRFHLRDNSTNGTVVVVEDGTHTRLHREELMLAGSGTITLGATPEEDPGGTVRFRCE